MNTRMLYVAWRDPDDDQWSVVGSLRCEREQYVFEYTRGLAPARMGRVPGFAEIDRSYSSTRLFPFFQNRTMRTSRPDFGDFTRRFGMPSDATPWQQLEAGCGQKQTDNFDVIPRPEPVVRDGERFFSERFFVRGLLHVTEDVHANIVLALKAGDRLWPMRDVQNEHDPFAIALRWSSSDISALVGYVPWYLAADASKLLEHSPTDFRVTIEHVEPVPAPHTQRIRARIDGPWPDRFEPMQAEEFQPRLSAEGTPPS